MADFITDKPLVSIVDEDFNVIAILPEPSSYSATTSTLVDSARNSKGVVKGSVIQSDLAKIELEWKYLTAEEWSNILKLFNTKETFYNYVKFYNQDIQGWEVRRMYVNDRKTGMWRRDPTTHDVMGWTSCKLSLIDTGEGTFVNTYDFATDSWEKISRVAESGDAPNCYHIDDRRTITLTTGEEIEIRIIGFNHDEKVSGGTAGISVEMVDLLSDTFTYNDTLRNIDWEDCTLRSALNNDIYSTLPADLQDVIKVVKKKTNTGYGTSEVIDSEDKLWVVSMAEVYSEDAIRNCSYSGISNYADIFVQEGTQYEYYKNLIGDQDPRTACQDLQKKRNGSNSHWWLRTPCLYGSYRAWYFSYSGAYIRYDTVSSAYGVALGFCI